MMNSLAQPGGGYRYKSSEFESRPVYSHAATHWASGHCKQINFHSITSLRRTSQQQPVTHLVTAARLAARSEDDD